MAIRKLVVINPSITRSRHTHGVEDGRPRDQRDGSGYLVVRSGNSHNIWVGPEGARIRMSRLPIVQATCGLEMLWIRPIPLARWNNRMPDFWLIP